MKDGNQAAYSKSSRALSNGNMEWGYDGITLRDHITIAAMQGILARADGGIFNPDEVADKACLQAEAMLRRMP